MMYPILFSDTETDFTHNGIGMLSDCISCEVTEELNGPYELEMEYPISGIHYSKIRNRCILQVQANQADGLQLFRIYSQSRPMNGVVTVYAAHISYDLSGIPCSPFTATGTVAAMDGLLTHAVGDCPFRFWTDKQALSVFTVSTPKSVRACLGGESGSIIHTFGGELAFDNFTVRLYNKRGMDRGVSIRYGKNLTDLHQEENCSNCFTGIYPFWRDLDGKNLVQLPEKVVNAPGMYNYTRIKTVDFSLDFEQRPTEGQLRDRASRYIRDNDIGIPAVSLDVEFVPLEIGSQIPNLERVYLGDTVSVEFPAMGVSSKSKAVRMVYDALKNRVKQITLGSVRASITDSIVQSEQLQDKITGTGFIQQEASAATAWLTNGKGYKVERRDANGNTIDTLYMDTPDINTAVNVLREGQSGIGFSHSGVGGPYVSAWTIDGDFDASFIKTGSMDANLIRAGVIKSQNGRLSINLDTGDLSIDSEFGLHLSPEAVNFDRQGTEMQSAINELGIQVKRSGQPVLIADARGVDAADLHARNYLIIGENSRFEDIGKNRTGCYWIGGDQ